MSAGDHLVSGLVPLVLIAGAALIYGRVRAGARATLALLLRLFGVVVGTEAVYYTMAGATPATTTRDSFRYSPASCCSAPAP